MDLPPVIDYDTHMSAQEAQWVCQEYVDQRQKPCTVITIEEKVCYAYSELDGSTDEVHCFIKLDNEEEEK